MKCMNDDECASVSRCAKSNERVSSSSRWSRGSSRWSRGWSRRSGRERASDKERTRAAAVSFGDGDGRDGDDGRDETGGEDDGRG